MTDDEYLQSMAAPYRAKFDFTMSAIRTQVPIPFRKNLYVQVLDALSSLVYPPSTSNRDRMVETLKRFSGWSHVDHVSLHHLVAVLTRNPDPALEDVRLYSLKEYGAWRGKVSIPVSADPRFDEIRSRLPKGQSEKSLLGSITLSSLTHGHLFYIFRNSLVHELTEPNASFGDDGDEPYYFNGEYAVEHGMDAYCLIYPSGFLQKICHAAIDSVFTYLEENRLNPFRSWGPDYYWLRELQR